MMSAEFAANCYACCAKGRSGLMRHRCIRFAKNLPEDYV